MRPINKIHRFKSKAEWLKFRGHKTLGGSSVATILGLNEWESPLDLWLYITEREQRPEPNSFMEYGTLAEPMIASWFDQQSGHKVVKNSASDFIMVHPEYDYIVASPDRFFRLNGSKKKADMGVLEIKTTTKSLEIGDIPPSYYVQNMLYAGMFGVKHLAIAWEERFNVQEPFRFHIMDFDQSIYDLIISEMADFWNKYVLTDTPPPAINAKDVMNLYKPEPGKVIYATQEVENIYYEHYSIKLEKKAYNQKDEELSNKIKLIMKDAEKLIAETGELLYTFKGDKQRRLTIKG